MGEAREDLAGKLDWLADHDAMIHTLPWPVIQECARQAAQALRSSPGPADEGSRTVVALPEDDAALEALCRLMWNERQDACARFGANIPMPIVEIPVDRLARLLALIAEGGGK